QMALDVEVVVGGVVHRDEALGGTYRLEPLHLTFSSSEGLVGYLDPLVLVNPLFVDSAQADFLEHGAVRALLLGLDPVRTDAVLPEQLADELSGGGFVPPALD